VEILKGLKVIKEPLPTDYLDVLEPAKAKKVRLTKDQIHAVKEKHLKDDIYALTGATISSRAVTNGVRDTVRKFVYRLDILTDALKQRISVTILREVKLNRNVRFSGTVDSKILFLD
jgi:electron transport complex protein RnfG